MAHRVQVMLLDADGSSVSFGYGVALLQNSDRQGLVLSRIRAAPNARLSHLSFEGQGAFASQC